jgi:hypothetical protein
VVSGGPVFAGFLAAAFRDGLGFVFFSTFLFFALFFFSLRGCAAFDFVGLLFFGLFVAGVFLIFFEVGGVPDVLA